MNIRLSFFRTARRDGMNGCISDIKGSPRPFLFAASKRRKQSPLWISYSNKDHPDRANLAMFFTSVSQVDEIIIVNDAHMLGRPLW